MAYYCGLCIGVCRILVNSICGSRPPPPKPQFDVLCIGMGGAGKSTILALAAGEDASNLDPTIGFNIKAITTSKVILNVKELGGGDSVRPYWSKYLTGVEAIVVVVDSTDDEEAMLTAFKEIRAILQEESLRSLPLMVLLHKQDLNPISEQEIQAQFDVGRLREGRILSLVFTTSYESPKELKQCFEEMSEQLLSLYAIPKETEAFSNQYKQFS